MANTWPFTMTHVEVLLSAILGFIAIWHAYSHYMNHLA